MRIAANKAYCRICRTALLTRKSLIPMRTSAKSVPRKKRTAATPNYIYIISYPGGHCALRLMMAYIGKGMKRVGDWDFSVNNAPVSNLS